MELRLETTNLLQEVVDKTTSNLAFKKDEEGNDTEEREEYSAPKVTVGGKELLVTSSRELADSDGNPVTLESEEEETELVEGLKALLEDSSAE